jgi:hypothetical protein
VEKIHFILLAAAGVATPGAAARTQTQHWAALALSFSASQILQLSAHSFLFVGARKSLAPNNPTSVFTLVRSNIVVAL